MLETNHGPLQSPSVHFDRNLARNYEKHTNRDVGNAELDIRLFANDLCAIERVRNRGVDDHVSVSLLRYFLSERYSNTAIQAALSPA